MLIVIGLKGLKIKNVTEVSNILDNIIDSCYNVFMNGGNNSNFKKQNEFPLILEYAKVFKITNKTIFAWDGCIYCDYELPDYLLAHEQIHLEQQETLGLESWLNGYLKDPQFRLDMEVEAYLEELDFIKDRNFRSKIRVESAKALSSSLYGNIINYEDALKLLWKK